MSPSPDIASKPEVKALIAQTETILAEAEAFKITTPAQYQESAAALKRVKSHQKQLEEMELEITRPINAGLKAIRDLFRTPRDRAGRAESLIKRAMIGYSDEQDRIRREEQRKADEAARREQEKLQDRAAKAAAAGKVEKAAELETRAATVVAPVINREPPKVAGVSDRLNWKFEVTDPAALPREYTMPDEKKIGAIVRAMKGDTNIPGVRVWSEKNIAAGAA